MPYIGKEPVAGNFVLLDSITTSATATYALTKDSVAYSPESARNMIVSLNGVTQAPEAAFTVSGSNITFSSALTASDVIDYILVLGDVLSVGTPSDGTVGTSQMSYPLGNFSSTGIDDNATSTAITIDSSENVGIGTASPASFNQVGADTLVVGSGSGEQGITIYSGTANNGVLAFADGTTTTEQYQGYIGYNHSSSFMRFFTGATERMRIDSSGDVSIGTDSCDFQSANRTILQVEGTTDSMLNLSDGTSHFYLHQRGAGVDIWSNSNYEMRFGTNNTERMRITSSGDLGIGTTSPSAKVHISGTAPAIRFQDTAAGDVWDIENLGGALTFDYGNTERMRIDSSGNLLVNRTTQVVGGKISVDYQNGIDAGIALKDTQTTGTGVPMQIVNGAGSVVGSITHDQSNTSFNTSSDERLKENIVDAPSGSIDGIRVRSFDWKESGVHQTYGMIAQELVGVAPEAVTKETAGNDMWSIDYSKLVPMMIKEIQDLRARVAQLEGA